MRVPTVAAALVGFALVGCGPNPDKVRPDLPRVTVEVQGMT